MRNRRKMSEMERRRGEVLAARQERINAESLLYGVGRMVIKASIFGAILTVAAFYFNQQ